MPAFLYCMGILYLRECVACHTLGGYIVEHVGSFYAMPTGTHNLNNVITMQCLVVNFLIYYIMHTPQEHCSNLSNVCAYSDKYYLTRFHMAPHSLHVVLVRNVHVMQPAKSLTCTDFVEPHVHVYM